MAHRAGLDLTFRAARPDDVPALRALVEACYRGDPSREGWTTEADLRVGPRTSDAEVAAVVSGPDSRMICCESGGDLLACCQLERRADGWAYLGMLSVRPPLQDRGIGRALLAEAERVAAREWGLRRMRMLVLRQRSELIAWYERLGYRRTGETVPFPPDTPDVPQVPDLEFAVLARDLA